MNRRKVKTMTLYKHICTCGHEWIDEDEHSECEMEEEHDVNTSKDLKAEDYANALSEDFENANYHGLTEVPEQILKVIKKYSKTNATKIMKALYEEVEWIT